MGKKGNGSGSPPPSPSFGGGHHTLQSKSEFKNDSQWRGVIPAADLPE